MVSEGWISPPTNAGFTRATAFTASDWAQIEQTYGAYGVAEMTAETFDEYFEGLIFNDVEPAGTEAW
jgi:hypothetical protein